MIFWSAGIYEAVNLVALEGVSTLAQTGVSSLQISELLATFRFA
jgi:hypothetical protein